MATERKIREALEKVIDPHIGISVVDMGMIREILIDEEQVEVRMVLTAPWQAISSNRCARRPRAWREWKKLRLPCWTNAGS